MTAMGRHSTGWLTNFVQSVRMRPSRWPIKRYARTCVVVIALSGYFLRFRARSAA